MIYTVYLNPTIDKTVYLTELNLGKTNRPYKTVQNGAGKAINVSVVLKELGQNVVCMGFHCEGNGHVITERLENKQIKYNFINIGGDARVNIKIFDGRTQEITEINEQSVFIEKSLIEDFLAGLESAVQSGDMVVLTGSLPAGCDEEIYANMIALLSRKGAKCIIDADGEALRFSLEKKPFLIKPNLDELKKIYPDFVFEDIGSVICAAKLLAGAHAEIVAVSMGKDGALITDGRETYFSPPETVDVLSTVGAGDSMVAGMIAAIDQGLSEMLRSGVAAALASIIREGTNLMKMNDYQNFLGKVKVQKM